MLLSTLCIIHCIALPVLIFVVPTFAATYLENDESFHQVLLALVVAAALLAFIPGFRLHRKIRPVLWCFGGLAFLSFSAFFAHDTLGHEAEPYIAILGSLGLVRAHYINHKLCKHCGEHAHAFCKKGESSA